MSIWPPICLPEDHLKTMNSTNISLEATYLGTILEPDLDNFTQDDFEEFEFIGDYKYFIVKVLLIVWDFVSFVLNGFGIDLLWHRVEVNHAVYNVLLQDVVLACLTSLTSFGISGYVWADDLTWFRLHSFLTLIPLVFHQWTWAIVAHLRYIFSITCVITNSYLRAWTGRI